ncbi:fungal-specific transcription factor domain-domain-containing protein [Naematelia encephala]|uniref:Fungal-specific transcription factor domain-domain-containing protein n=1 Tax=Naematelia encephala TaxID=71784 RepID=A0A1Y2BL28_9TREE|nr:fungal-specific transcription factor domain-domain-containing protein [Naematelia encephala]
MSPTSSRTKQSCTECRRRKIKCNRRIPCDMCIARDDQDHCEEQVSSETRGDQSYPRLKDFRLLAARVSALEAQLLRVTRLQVDLDSVSHLSSSVQANHDPISDSINTQPRLLQTSTGADKADSSSSFSPVRAEDDSVALVLEDFAMGHSGNLERAGKQQGPRMSALLAQAVGKAVSILPDANRSMLLVTSFFTHVDWTTKVLHAPSYLDEFNQFAALPKDQAAMAVRPEWLSVHLIVICLSLHLLDESERQKLGLRSDQWQEIAKGLFLASREVLFASDFLSYHTLDHLQCIVLQGGYQYDTENSHDSHWAMIGSAVKIAQNLGLHRLGSEDLASKTAWPSPWKSPLRREIGRRVWWNIVYLDWSHALSHGTTYCVHPNHSNTAFPSNVDDIDMTPQTVKPSQPLSIYTSSTFTIFRLQFLSLYREHIDHLISHQPASYEFIKQMDSRLVALRDSLPPYFSDNVEALRLSAICNSSCVVSESIAIRIIAANRLLRLHRPYLTLGYHDPRYRQSTEQCVLSAQTILGLCETARVAAPTVLNYWLILFYAFAAAIVIFIRLCNNEQDDKRQSRQLLHRVVETLRGAQEFSAAARNAISILENLLSE